MGRRTDVVGVFPDDRSLIRLVGMLCLELNDEWLVSRRYLSAAAMEPLLEKPYGYLREGRAARTGGRHAGRRCLAPGHRHNGGAGLAASTARRAA
jgi:hypothetical protein